MATLYIELHSKGLTTEQFRAQVQLIKGVTSVSETTVRGKNLIVIGINNDRFTSQDWKSKGNVKREIKKLFKSYGISFVGNPHSNRFRS